MLTLAAQAVGPVLAPSQVWTLANYVMTTREAKRVCMSCEVRAECLEYALEHDERFGIWGGLSERERRRLKRQAG